MVLASELAVPGFDDRDGQLVAGAESQDHARVGSSGRARGWRLTRGLARLLTRGLARGLTRRSRSSLGFDLSAQLVEPRALEHPHQVVQAGEHLVVVDALPAQHATEQADEPLAGAQRSRDLGLEHEPVSRAERRVSVALAPAASI